MNDDQELKLFQLYKEGKMNPDQTAQYENDLRAGIRAIPKGETPNIIELPQKISDAYVNGQLTPQQKADLEADMFHGFVRLPPSSSGVIPTDMPMSIEKPDDLRRLEPSMWEKIKGAGEAALSAATGMAGQFIATPRAIGRTVGEGTFGTEAGSRAAEEYASQMAGEMTYQPRTQPGQEYIKTVGEVGQAMQPLMGLTGELGALGSGDVLNYSISKAQAPTKLNLKLTNQIKASRADPELARQVSTVSRDVQKFIKSMPEQAPEQIQAALPAPKNISQAIKQPGISQVDAQQVASRTKATQSLQQMEDLIRERQGNAIADKFSKVRSEIEAGNTAAMKEVDNIAEQIATAAPDKSLAKYTINGAGKIKTDPLAAEAMKQGFDQGVVAVIKGATKEDRSKMAEMANMMQKGKQNSLYAAKNRPSDIAGYSLLNRVNYIKKVNLDAAKQLDNTAKSLRGQTADFSQPISNFANKLDEMGIRFDKNGRPNFKNSDIDSPNLKASQLAVADMVMRINRVMKSGKPDAYEMHRIKRFIDEQVTYGKSGEGLSGRVEGIFKGLRREIDSVLDDNFSNYNNVNTRYSDTITALNNLQDVAGKKMDLYGPNADKAVGTLLRRLMSNAQSRINLTDSVDELNFIAQKYGAKFNDDVTTQMLFADELDKVFGPVARTSLAGEAAKGTKAGLEYAVGQKTLQGLAIEKISNAAEKARGISNDAAMKSIQELLKRD